MTFSRAFLELAAEHPLLACFAGLFLAIAVILGSMHEVGIAVDALIPVVHHFRRECEEWRDTWGRLKAAFARRKSEP